MPASRPSRPSCCLQREVEADPLRVVGHRAGRLLQRLAEHGHELAAAGDARRGARSTSPDGIVTSY